MFFREMELPKIFKEIGRNLPTEDIGQVLAMESEDNDQSWILIFDYLTIYYNIRLLVLQSYH